MYPTPVFLTGEFHGQRSLVGSSPWGRKKLDMAKSHTHTHTHTHKYTDIKESHICIIIMYTWWVLCRNFIMI